jgi:hypothetical protein
MSEVRLTWSVGGQVQLDRQFTRLAIEVTDFEEPLRAAGVIVYDETRAQFAAQGNPPWPTLDPVYAALKKRLFPGKTMLRVTDALMHSVTDPAAEGAIYELTKTSLTIGSDIRVGRWNLGLIHQEGAPRARIDPRPMLRLLETAKRNIIRGFRTWFMAEAVRQGVQVTP